MVQDFLFFFFQVLSQTPADVWQEKEMRLYKQDKLSTLLRLKYRRHTRADGRVEIYELLSTQKYIAASYPLTVRVQPRQKITSKERTEKKQNSSRRWWCCACRYTYVCVGLHTVGESIFRFIIWKSKVKWEKKSFSYNNLKPSSECILVLCFLRVNCHIYISFCPFHNAVYMTSCSAAVDADLKHFLIQLKNKNAFDWIVSFIVTCYAQPT